MMVPVWRTPPEWTLNREFTACSGRLRYKNEMMRPSFRNTSAIAAFLVLLLLAGVPALADDDERDHEEALQAVRSGAVLPLRSILDIVHEQFAGEMLEAELEQKRGAWVYEIELITQRGTILKLHYAGADGTLLRARGHRLMHAYKGDPAALPEALRRRHDHMMRHMDGATHEGRPWHRRWFRHLWGDDDVKTEGGE